MVEMALGEAPGGPGREAPVPAPACPITEVAGGQAGLLPTGLVEVDRVMGGGLLAGSVTLVGGPPGVGKSTLLLQLARSWAEQGRRVLYLSAEESAQQVRRRADRLDAVSTALWLAADTSLPAIASHVAAVAPELVIVDSIQTVHDPALASAPGSVAQVRHVAHQLVAVAKSRGVPLVMVTHVTKEGGLAGPRVLEHLVDTVLSFDGDTGYTLRLLRAQKHRFGPTDELGVLEMSSEGLRPVADPSGRFLADRHPGAPGSVVVPTLEGQRPLLVEVQALVARSSLATPRRSAQGLDSGRLNVVLGVLQERVGISVAGRDVYAMAVGGARLVEPAGDLAVALAVASACAGRVLDADLVACGEVGLGGELRRVVDLDRRLVEAARLGFRRAVVPTATSDGPPRLRLHRCADVGEAIVAAGALVPA